MIRRNEHIAIIRNDRAIAKVADYDSSVVDTKQLIEVQITGVVEYRETRLAGSCCSTGLSKGNGRHNKDRHRHQQSPGQGCRKVQEIKHTNLLPNLVF